MDRDANYVAVGAFVLLLLAMAAGFVFWYSETGDRQSYERHEIYFEGSVFGLSEGSSVRYLGVAVGRVVRISLDPRDPSRVRVVADISEATPIEEQTVARLALQGVTGLLFIDLKPADPGKRRSAPVPSIQHPVIPSERSDFDVFVSSLPDAIAKASEALSRMNAMLSDRNIESVAAAIGSIEEATADLPSAIADTRRLLARAEAVAAEMHATTAAVRDVATTSTPELKKAITNLHDASASLASMSARVDGLIAANEGSISRFTGDGLVELQALVRDLRDTSRSFEALSRRLEEDPSQLIYQPTSRGVEIPQ